MFLPDNYKKCGCGEKLHKRNRFAVKLEAPVHINTYKREKENKPYRTKTIVNYCCEKCYQKLYNEVPKIINTTNWFIYYGDISSYPV